MKTKPILFSTEMVQAILEGRKIQTRRIIKKKYSNTDLEFKDDKYGRRLIERQNDVPEPIKNEDGTTTHHLRAFSEVKPKYNIGDVLWARETFQKLETVKQGLTEFLYKADIDLFNPDIVSWSPSIHMPKEAARIFLKVKNVRCERLQDISEEDAIAEGCSLYGPFGEYKGAPHPNKSILVHRAYRKASRAYQSIWEHINGVDSWKENRWVWVYEFEKIEKPENFLE
ncbi:MAG: hypothetical protein WCJ72_03335 [Chryseobacterium sp.]